MRRSGTEVSAKPLASPEKYAYDDAAFGRALSGILANSRPLLAHGYAVHARRRTEAADGSSTEIVVTIKRGIVDRFCEWIVGNIAWTTLQGIFKSLI